MTRCVGRCRHERNQGAAKPRERGDVLTKARPISATPYAWPHDGQLRPSCTALVVIDMQRDFCAPGGYVSALGYDIGPARQIIPRIADLIDRTRAWGGLVVHTREGHRPDLSDLPDHKLWRSRNGGAAIGSKGPLGRLLIRGEEGWDFVPELTPREGDIIIDKAGYSAFYATDLERIFRAKGVEKLILAGVTTDVCVHSTLRDATDRGYECLVVEDACAATDPANHHAALATIATEGGIFGAIAKAREVRFQPEH